MPYGRWRRRTFQCQDELNVGSWGRCSVLMISSKQSGSENPHRLLFQTFLLKGWLVSLSHKGEQLARRDKSMKNVPGQETVTQSSPVPSRLPRHSIASFLLGGVYLFTGLLIVLALVAGVGLLLDDLALHQLVGLPHAPVSAAPLLLIGAASLGFQILTRPKPLDLFKALLISSAFIFWGVDQMLPSGRLATMVGDVVIVSTPAYFWLFQRFGEAAEQIFSSSCLGESFPLGVV